MATLRKNSQHLLLKELSGSIGDFIIKNYNGKTVICSKPKKYIVSQTPQSKALREVFRTASKFASFINKIPTLSMIWKSAKIEGPTTSNKIVKHNYRLFNTFHPTADNVITPPHFQFRIRDVIIYEDNIEIIMEEWFVPNPNDKCIIIMLLLDPIETSSDEFVLTDISPANSTDFTITLNDDQLRRCTEYKSFIIYTAIYRQKEDEVQWSNTVALEGKIQWN